MFQVTFHLLRALHGTLSTSTWARTYQAAAGAGSKSKRTPEVTYNKGNDVCLGHVCLSAQQKHFASCHQVRHCFKVYLQAPAPLNVLSP